MSQIAVRYPGRACLLGEHCDWAGGASLTVPLPMGVEIRGETTREDVVVRSALEGELLEGRWTIANRGNHVGPLRYVSAAIAELIGAGIELKPAELWINSNLPYGRGFSSSAAFTLGVIDALSRLAMKPMSTHEIIELAYRAEHRQLGIRCGRLDPAACAAGQPVFFKWVPDQEGRIQMTTHRVHPTGTLHLVVGAFMRPRNTQQILRTLHQNMARPLQDSKGDSVREALTVFARTAETGALAMQNGDLDGLGAAMDTAQHAYEEHLSNRFKSLRATRLTTTCTALKQQGALGAKFSGAGGDGSIVALFRDENSARAAAIRLEESDMLSWYVPVEAP